MPGMRMLILGALFTVAAIPKSSAADPAEPLPSEQQVLTFIGSTIDWYRHLPTSQQIGSETVDLFLSGGQPANRDGDRPPLVSIWKRRGCRQAG